MAASHPRRHWLVKSEPSAFSFDDLVASTDRTACWDGVRNYQARNSMRDDMRVGDLVFFYHSNADPAAIVGICEVVRAAYADHTALDPDDAHYDPKAKADPPTWVMVDLRALAPLARPHSLAELKATKGLEKMVLLQKGSRLSVQPVTAVEWAIVTKLGGGARSRR
jgi:predicted RNA-binding protein with PUA-like domain